LFFECCLLSSRELFESLLGLTFLFLSLLLLLTVAIAPLGPFIQTAPE
jgi:hypothetical protein